jgi:hypothetical protein
MRLPLSSVVNSSDELILVANETTLPLFLLGWKAVATNLIRVVLVNKAIQLMINTDFIIIKELHRECMMLLLFRFVMGDGETDIQILGGCGYFFLSGQILTCVASQYQI